ncbi:Adenylyl-sulfate kinase 3 [Morella rubra]|uniref:Adenylyl-sulfate kinase n=1 Tax=Morella rubra TaxID=262757 RepID=A0A6A1WA25_9ROSI|nr:Adenylyl-sulfate kinase 3 [Morella rubra]
MSTLINSTNIFWQECPVGKVERQKLLNQKGCVLWITGLSGSGKSTLACSVSRELHSRGKLSYVLDGDNLRHGLNKDLGFKQEDRTENIRRVGEVAKLFADAGLICIASLISPYRKDRDACRAMLPDENFIEARFLVMVFMNMPLALCEARDTKGLYKLARAGKIKGFTGIDDPYEPPLNCEIEIQNKDGICPAPGEMAKQVVSYLEEKGFLLDHGGLGRVLGCVKHAFPISERNNKRRGLGETQARGIEMVLNSPLVAWVANVSADLCQYIACNPERVSSDGVLHLLFCVPFQHLHRLALTFCFPSLSYDHEDNHDSNSHSD